jgi:hypothetical protein
MSQAAAKVSRRQIRKALGPDTVDTVQRMAAGLDNHAQHIDALTARLSDIEAGHLPAIMGRVASNELTLAQHIDRGFFGRLKWLVLGK